MYSYLAPEYEAVERLDPLTPEDWWQADDEANKRTYRLEPLVEFERYALLRGLTNFHCSLKPSNNLELARVVRWWRDERRRVECGE